MIRRGALLGLVLAAAEVGLTALALLAFAEVPKRGGTTALWLALGSLAVVLVVFALLQARFLGALREVQGDLAAGPSPGGLAEVHGLRRATAVQSGLRLLVAVAAAATGAALMLPLGLLSQVSLLALVSTVASSVAVVEVWRPVVLGRLLWSLAAQADPAEGRVRWRRGTLTWDLTWTGLCTGAAGLVAVAAFTHFFIPLDPPQRQAVLAFFPITVVAITGLWLLVLRRLVRPVRRYLQALAAGAGRPVEGAVAVRAFRAAQVLPYTLAASKVGAFGLGGLLIYVEGVWLFGIDRDSATLVAGATGLAAIAAALYEAFWHRSTLRAMLADLAARHRLDVEAVRSPLSLRVKMFAGFGLVLFLACAIAIFWSFVQVRNLAVSFVQKQSKLKAEGLVDRLRTQEKIRGPVRPAEVSGLLSQLAGAGEEIYWYLPPTGSAERFAAPGSDSPALPFLARTRMRRLESGVLRHPDLGLVGAFLRVRLGGRDLGSVAVLYPDQRREAPPGPRAAVLGVFFLVLFLLCSGIVVLIAADLSAPLQALERRAGEMARGDLQHPVVTGAEADEVGRLAFALDAMRRSLEEQIRTVEELNVSLEEKVEKRTSDLARANADLREALERLTKAQDQLVRSEKMASIGQLVAGVAHELNNPINAVGNTLSPLEGALRALVERSDAPGEGAPAEETVADVQAMLRVIRNGTTRIQRIVHALSGYARADGDRSVAVDLNGLVEETLEIARHLLAEVALERDLAPLPPVPGDAGQLGQVLMNLVANAAQALAEEPPPRRLRVSTRALHGHVEVAVADSGPGVPEALRSRVFDPFFTTKAVGQGTGLGLSISQEIVAGHGGRLELEETPGGGATFRVRLPLRPAPR